MAPRDHRGWGNLAETLGRIDGENDQSMEAYIEATKLAKQKLEINSQDWRTYAKLAIYLAHTGEIEEAKVNSERALSLSGRHPEALLYAADVNLADDNIGLYLSLLEEMVAKDASYRQLIDIDNVKFQDMERFQAIIATP